MIAACTTYFFSCQVTSFSMDVSKPHSIHSRSRTMLKSNRDSDTFVEKSILEKCAEKSVAPEEIISLLKRLDKDRQKGFGEKIEKKNVEGVFELIFSSAVADLPVIGGLVKGYMPNKELITFDFAEKQMSLIVQTLPFVPSIDIFGDNLTWKEEGALEYTVRGKDSASRWDILYADDSICAAKSSVTGFNVIKRI